MKKIRLFACLALLLATRTVRSQELKQYPVRTGPKNEIFDKAFAGIIASSAHNFKSLQNESGIKSIIDTTYDVKFNFQEQNEGKLTCEKTYVSLGVMFPLDSKGLNTLTDHLMASLPANFVYTLEYDALGKQSSYTFFAKPGTKTVPANYPEKIYLTTDVNNTAIIGFFINR